MPKSIVTLCYFWFLSLSVNAQQITPEMLTGQWRFTHGQFVLYVTYTNDSAAVYTTKTGIIISNRSYKITPYKEGVKFNYKVKNTNIKGEYLLNNYGRLLNDSILLHSKQSSVTEKVDTTKHYIVVYKKLRDEKIISPRWPNFNDLAGDWYDRRNNKRIVFKDASHATFINEDGIIKEVTYDANFEIVPTRIKFTYTETGKEVLGLLRFLPDNKFMFELFSKDSQSSGFTIFGGKKTYSRKPLLNQ